MLFTFVLLLSFFMMIMPLTAVADGMDAPACVQIVLALECSFLECDEQFMATLKPVGSNPAHSKGQINAGCCAIVVLIKQHTLYVANVGDCRAVLVCERPVSGTCYLL